MYFKIRFIPVIAQLNFAAQETFLIIFNLKQLNLQPCDFFSIFDEFKVHLKFF